MDVKVKLEVIEIEVEEKYNEQTIINNSKDNKLALVKKECDVTTIKCEPEFEADSNWELSQEQQSTSQQDFTNNEAAEVWYEPGCLISIEGEQSNDDDASAPSQANKSKYIPCGRDEERKYDKTKKFKKTRGYSCDICGTSFSKEYKRNEHLLAHTDPLACYVCQKRFISDGELKEHIASVHSCPMCGKVYTTKSNLNKHMKIHDVLRSMYTCHLCTKQFNTSHGLKLHIGTMHNKESHVCTVCGKMYTQKYSLNQHMKIHGTEDTRMGVHETEGGPCGSVNNQEGHACATCGKVFSLKGTLTTHMKVHDTVREIYTCDGCKKQYTSPGGLRLHIASVHNKESHVCITCGKMFTQKGYLNTHMKVHEMESNTLKRSSHKKKLQGHEWHVCFTCGYLCDSKNILKDHLKTHGIPQDVYTCHYCHSVFTNKVLIKYHIKSKHGDKRATYACDVCNKKYIWKSTRDNHRKGHTEPHTCHLCHKEFTISSNLKTHIDSVHNREGYVCTTCGKVSTRKDNLDKHMRIHDTERQSYTCDTCNRCFISKLGIKHHIRKQHS